MPVVVVRCPSTKRDISTGIEIEPEIFARLPHVLSKTCCPACGAIHIWWPRIARLADSDPPVEDPVQERPANQSNGPRAGPDTSPAAAQINLFCEIVAERLDETIVETKLAEALKTLLPVKRRTR